MEVNVWDAQTFRGRLPPGASWFPNMVNGVYVGPVLHVGLDGTESQHAMGDPCPCNHPNCADREPLPGL